MGYLTSVWQDSMYGAAEHLRQKYMGGDRDSRHSTRDFQIAMDTAGKGHDLPLSNFLNAQCIPPHPTNSPPHFPPTGFDSD